MEIDANEQKLIDWAKAAGFTTVDAESPQWFAWLDFRKRHKMKSDFWASRDSVTVPKIDFIPHTFPNEDELAMLARERKRRGSLKGKFKD